MSAEELNQRYPNDVGLKVGDYEVFQTQLTTLNQFAAHGILPSIDFGAFKTQKCDCLVISRVPEVRAVLIGEHKRPGELTDANWHRLAQDLLTTKCNPVGAPLGYLTDSIRTYWINGTVSEVSLVERQDTQPMPTLVDFADGDFARSLSYILTYFEPATGQVRAKSLTNPDYLASQVWQTIWRLRADKPEDCLATFVELFIYKFLCDLGLIGTGLFGEDISLDYILGLSQDKCYEYYYNHVRGYVRQLFPPGDDGYSVINGIVLQPSNRDHNIIFHELMLKFQRFGSLRNTESDFKRRLYESFLQESKTASTFGQFFTPRKIVAAIYEMADIAGLTPGKDICDPAAGVGGFVLEQMAQDLASQWQFRGSKMKSVHNWHAWERVDKTSILAKANALVHCGSLLADRPKRVKDFANWLNSTFYCYDTTALGSLEVMPSAKFDLIMTNPPFVVSGSKDYGKIVKSNNKRQKYYSQKASGVEGLFVQMIVNALKLNGEAWVLLPETFFLRSTDKVLRKWLLSTCRVDFLSILPEQTFYNTSKRVVIVHLQKRPSALVIKSLVERVRSEMTVVFAVSDIGETRDVRRLPCKSDLPEMIQAYRARNLPEDIIRRNKRAVSVPSARLIETTTTNLRHFWSQADAIELGLLASEEDPAEARELLQIRINAIQALMLKWGETSQDASPPETPSATKTVKLGDESLFRLRIGKRVLKKNIYKIKTGIPLYSANIRKEFGYVHAANAGRLENGGVLWSIDSDFDARKSAPGESYSITDHCGEVQILEPAIDPMYLASQIRKIGAQQGFNREYRPSLGVMAEIEIDLPVRPDGAFDLDLMKRWSAFEDSTEQRKYELNTLLH